MSEEYKLRKDEAGDVLSCDCCQGVLATNEVQNTGVSGGTSIGNFCRVCGESGLGNVWEFGSDEGAQLARAIGYVTNLLLGRIDDIGTDEPTETT